MSEGPAPPLVGVVLLHWGPAAVTARCLESLARVSYPRLRVFVVDNAGDFETDGADGAGGPPVRVLRPGRNLGFAEGSTSGIDAALTDGVDYVLLLNNDVVAEPDFLGRLVEGARATGAGLACPQIAFLNDPDQAWYAGGRFSLWLGIPRHAGWRRAIRRDGVPREVGFATGCAMLIDPRVIATVGSFDARFFIYCEDLDLSLRARRAGFRLLIVPGALVHHAVVEDGRLPRRLYYTTRNLLEVMRRHAGWYHWVTFVPSFALGWVGFFALVALRRRQPAVLAALARGALDFLRGRLGEQAPGPAPLAPQRPA